jgi:hypothetical protein
VSATAHVAVLDAPGRRSEPSRIEADATPERVRIRLATFAALGLYGALRWATLLAPAPGWRLLGLFGLALVLAAAGPWIRLVSVPAAILAAAVALLAALAVAGVPLAWVVHHRVGVTAHGIGQGLAALPGVLLPYNGINGWIRVVIVLGAGVLLLDAALVLAFAPRAFGDLWRAAAALPLTALAVVPSTLVRPQLPYLQGLLLFGLLAAFMWGERLRRHVLGAAIALAALVGVGAMIAAPSLDQHTPWLNYRAWANTFAPAHVDVFDWNQTYGPLKWPRSGHEVLEVRATNPDYWKAQNLDVFNGFGWSQGPGTVGAQIPPPDAAATARWTQQLTVTIEGMRTTDVIAAGTASDPTSIPGGAVPGVSSGTWSAARELGPGTSYRVTTYSPHPTPAQLAHAGKHYPNQALADFRSIELPRTALSIGVAPEVRFPPFHSHAPIESVIGAYGVTGAGVVEQSPYAGAFALAQGLASRAATPYQFVRSVQRYLSVSNGFSYNQNAPVRTYPLESFLFTDKLGYCQQFSGAMALLLRMGGIPARVASGFTSGSYDKTTHEWVVSDLDAHAWVEVWFPHYGWVRFDPTPAAAPARSGLAPIPVVKRLPGENAAASHAPREITATGAPGTSQQHHGGRGVEVLVVVLAVVLALALASVALLRMRRGAEPSDDRLVLELERALARCGRPVSDGVTLASLEQRFRYSPAAADYIRAIRLARFGAGGQPPNSAQRKALRGQLGLGLGPVGRLRALWALPPRPASFMKRSPRSLHSE